MEFSEFGKKFSDKAGILSLMDDMGKAMGCGRDVIMMGGGNPGNVPDLDSQMLYTAILHACQMCAFGKENRSKAAMFAAEYDKWFQKCMDRMGQRSRPRRATVRNVTDSPNVIPNWTGLGSF